MKSGDFMSLKYIFNGYFRSGTTIIWEIIKTSNPDYKVFYEPFHDYLVERIKESIDKKNSVIVDNLHKKILWEEYVAEGEKFIENLEEKGFKNQIFPKNISDIYEYLNIYDSMDSNIILQTNRLHFHFQDVLKHYDLKAFHIIRNPLDIYNSIMNIYSRSSKLKHLIKKIIYPFIGFPNPKTRAFKVDQRINFIYENYNIPNYWDDKSLKQEILNDPFKANLLSWILCNYFLIKNNYKNGVQFIVYEDLINNPRKIKKIVEKNSYLKFNIEKINTQNKSLDIYKEKKVLDTVKQLNLIDEYNLILDNIID